MNDQDLRQVYVEGFINKCAEYGIDPDLLAEQAFGKDAQLTALWNKGKQLAGNAYDAAKLKGQRLAGDVVEGGLNAATNVSRIADKGTEALGNAIHTGVKGGIGAARTGINAARKGYNTASNAVQQGYGSAVNKGMNAVDTGLTGAMQVAQQGKNFGEGVKSVGRGMVNNYNQGVANTPQIAGR